LSKKYFECIDNEKNAEYVFGFLKNIFKYTKLRYSWSDKGGEFKNELNQNFCVESKLFFINGKRYNIKKPKAYS